MARWLPSVARWTLRTLLGLLLVVLLIIGAACGYLYTDHGRARLLGTVVAEVNQLLPGTVEAGELSRLTPTEVVLHDLRLLARGGNELVRLQRVRARIAPWALLDGRVLVQEIVIENAAVDLRAIDDGELGLIPAVVPPSDDTQPDTGGSAPEIIFDGIRIENCRAYVPLAFEGAPDVVWLTSLGGRLSIGAQLGIDVRRLQARVLRDDADIGGVRATAGLTSLGRSHVELAGTLGGVELDVDLAVGTIDRELPGWPNSPFVLGLDVREMTAERLAALTRSAPLPLLGTFGARLGLRGTPAAFELEGSLETPGGHLALRSSNQDLSSFQFSAQTERLRLNDLATGWPARSVAGQLEGRLVLPSDGLEVSVAARTQVDGLSLPELSFRGEHRTGSPWQVEVGLRDRWLDLTARAALPASGAISGRTSGWVAPAPGLAVLQALGIAPESLQPFASSPPDATERLTLRLDAARSAAGDIEASAVFDAPRLRLTAGRFEKLRGAFSLAGRLPRPRVRLSTDWQAALEGSEKLVPGRLELEGGPSRYRIDLHGGSPGALHASGWVEREARGERFALTASGRHGGAPWRVAVQPGLLLDSGHVMLPGVELELDAQRARAHGKYAGAASELVVELHDVDVRRALGPLLPGTRLTGHVGGRIEARGALEQPRVSVDLRASRLGLEGAPMLDSSLRGDLDLGSGCAELAVDIHESTESSGRTAPRLDVRLRGGGRFDPRRPWPSLLSTGEQELDIEVKRLDSHLLAELAGGAAPGSFDLRGKAALHVKAGVPTLESLLTGGLAWTTPGSAFSAPTERSARLVHSLSHADRNLRTALSIDDASGRWLSLSGDVKLPVSTPPTLAALVSSSPRDLRRWVKALGWHLQIDAAPRAVEALPAWLGRPDLGSAEIGLRVAAHGEPGQAPAGTLALRVADTGRQEARRRCATRLLTTKAQVEIAANQVHATVEAFGGQSAGAESSGEKGRLLHATTAGALDLMRWLDGESPSWAALEVALDAKRLPLDGLPFVCGRLRGELTGRGKIRDPLGSPALEADLAVSRFSLGSDQTVDIGARVSVDPRSIALTGSVTADGHRSPLSLHWSRDVAAGSAQDTRRTSFEFEQLPLAPLLPLEGPISHVSGYLSGRLQSNVDGGGRELAGTLRFDQVALTVTELAQPLSDIGGEISFVDGAVVLKGLTGRDGDGVLTLNGRIEPHGGRSFDGDLTLVSRKFPLRQAGDVVAQTTATARLQVNWRPELRRLRVGLKDFDTWLERLDGSRGLSLEPHPDVTLKTRRRTGAQPEDETARAGNAPVQTPMIIEIDAPEQFWIKRADFALKLSANLKVAAGAAKTERDQGDVSVTGQLRFDRGYMEMMGKSFEVKRGGTLRFTGGTSAVLDLSAEYKDRRTDKLVVVRLQGSADAPSLEFQVDGRKVTAGEAFQAIYGSNASSDDVDPEAQADQIIGALMAGVLTTSMRRRLGAMAPILSVDAADEDRGEQLRAGFELDALIPEFLRDIVTGVYVEGSISSEKQADQAGSKDVQTGVLIELHFPYNLVSSGRYGPDTTWSLDLGWQP